MKKIYVMFLIFGLSFNPVMAQLLVEDFNYTTGDQLTAKGWSLTGTVVTNPILVTSPGLTFTGYVGSNIGLAAGLNNTGQDVNKSFGAQTKPGSVYSSFLVNTAQNHATSGYFFHYYDPTQSTNFRGRVYMTPKNGKLMVGFSFNASFIQDSLSTLLNTGETYLFVVKYEIIDSDKNDKVSLYVFKSGDDFTNEPSKPSIGPLTATQISTADTNLASDIIPTGIAIRQYDAGQKITVDGFRVKTKWDLKKDDATFVDNSRSMDLKVYPNPVTNGVIYISSSGNSVKHIEVYDIAGKVMINESTLSNQIDVSVLKSGFYILKVNVNGKSLTSKFAVN